MQRELQPLAGIPVRTAHLLGMNTRSPHPKSQIISPLLGHKAVVWSPFCPKVAPDNTLQQEKKKINTSTNLDESEVVAHIRKNIHQDGSYKAKRDLEDIETGKVKFSSILSRIAHKEPLNPNISAIGYQRRAISPQRNLWTSSSGFTASVTILADSLGIPHKTWNAPKPRTSPGPP